MTADLERIIEEMDKLSAKVDAMNDTLSGVLTLFAGIKNEVMPFLEKLENHPMLKMFLGGKTK